MTSFQARILTSTLLVVSLAVRLGCLDFLTDDVAYWVTPWYDFLRANGLAALGREFPNAAGLDPGANYTPPYYYLLYVATWFDALLPKLYLIKAISIAFDLVAAALVFAIVRLRFEDPGRAWAAFLAVLLAPTVIANGSLWGQCDSIHTSLILGSTYCALRRWPVATAALLGSALAFKAQAVFLLPFLLMLIVRALVPVWSVLVIPAVYLTWMMPAVIMGRPVAEVTSVYFHQAGVYRRLSMNAPNLYYFMQSADYHTWMGIGATVTILAALVFAWLPRQRRINPTREFMLLSATVSVAVAPFLLPGMHDRYFFAADVMSIALAFYVPRLWFVAAGFQVSSILAYVPIISDTLNHGAGEYRDLMPIAVLINVILVGVLAVVWGRAVRSGRVMA